MPYLQDAAAAVLGQVTQVDLASLPVEGWVARS